MLVKFLTEIGTTRTNSADVKTDVAELQHHVITEPNVRSVGADAVTQLDAGS